MIPPLTGRLASRRRTARSAAAMLVAILLAVPSSAQETPQATASPATNAARLGPTTQSDSPRIDTALDLAGALERALQDNPEILAAAARVDAAAERPAQASSLADPMVTGVFRNVSFTDITIGDEMMSMAGVRFTQSLPYKGKRDLRQAAAERGIDVSASRVELISRRIVREVSAAYFELEYLYRAIGIVESTRDYLLHLEQTAEARYAVGEGIQQDVLKAQVETSILLNRLIELDERREVVETDINRLLARPAAAEIGPPAQLRVPDWSLSLDGLEAEAVASSAIVRERRRQIEQQRASLEVTRRDTKPDWVLGGSWMTRGQYPDIWEVNVGITLPFRKGDKQERAIAEAAAEVRATELDLQDSSASVTTALRKEFLRADRADRLRRLYGEAIVPQATLSLESATAGYEVGRVDFLTVLDNVVTLLTYQLEFYRQGADYMQALAAMEEHVGRSLGVTPESIIQDLSNLTSHPEQVQTLPGGER